MNRIIYEILTWCPGVIFLFGYIFQIHRLYITKYPKEIDKFTFLIIFLGNMGAYLFTNKYFSLKAISAYIIPACFQLFIIGYSEYKKKRKKESIIYSVSLFILLFSLILFVSVFQKNALVKKKINSINEYAGLIALFYPIASGLQVYKMFKDKHSEGISVRLWIFLALGQFGLYFLVGKYTNIKSILAFIGSGVLNLVVAFYALYLREKKEHKK